MDSNLITTNYNNESNEPITKPIENEFDSNSKAPPIPVQNPDDCPPQESNNQNFQPQANPYYPNIPYLYNPNNHQAYPFYPNQPYNPNNPQVYPYYPNQPYPYNPNQPQPYYFNPPNPSQQNKKNNWSPNSIKRALLILSIIQFSFVVVEIIVLIIINYIGLIFVHIDEAGILVVSILFFLGYLDKCKINLKLRTIITGVVWFVGFGLRAVGNMLADHEDNNWFILIPFMIVRTFLLLFSIGISSMNSQQNLEQSNTQEK